MCPNPFTLYSKLVYDKPILSFAIATYLSKIYIYIPITTVAIAPKHDEANF